MKRVMWFLIILILCFDVWFLNYTTGIPFWYIQDAYNQWEWDRQPHIVETQFFNKDGTLFHTIYADGNICNVTGEEGPFSKKCIWDDGYTVVVTGYEYRTWGSGYDYR